MTELKPHLIIATDSFTPRIDGVTTFLITLIPYLKEYFKITIICPDFENNNVDIEGINFVRITLTKKYFGDFKSAKFKPSIISKSLNDADVVFSQTLGTIGSTAIYLANKKRKKTISFVHSIEWKLIPSSMRFVFLRKILTFAIKSFSSFIYQKCDYLIVPSERIADYLSWEKINQKKEIIHLGVDSNKFIPYYKNPNRLTIRAMHNIDEKDIVVGYHGRISYEKDLHTLIRAFVKLRNKYPNLKLMLVGNGIPEIIDTLKKQKGIIYVKGNNQVEDYLSAMDIYCMPSLTETTSLSTLEAMSTCLPVVTTGAGFIKDYIKHSYNGLIFPKKNSFHLTKELEYLYKNKEQRLEFGQRSRVIIEEQFSWDKTAKKLIGFLKDLVDIK